MTTLYLGIIYTITIVTFFIVITFYMYVSMYHKYCMYVSFNKSNMCRFIVCLIFFVMPNGYLLSSNLSTNKIIHWEKSVKKINRLTKNVRSSIGHIPKCIYDIYIFNSKLLDIKHTSYNENIYSSVVNEFYHHIFDIKQILLLYILLVLMKIDLYF